jgi:hypothetical protein
VTDGVHATVHGDQEAALDPMLDRARGETQLDQLLAEHVARLFRGQRSD